MLLGDAYLPTNIYSFVFGDVILVKKAIILLKISSRLSRHGPLLDAARLEARELREVAV